jgi:catechol 2,3-dioxygenase-like lactoylglutathione lyase family enzyme
MKAVPHHKGTDSYKPIMTPRALKLINGGISMNEVQANTTDSALSSPVKNKIGSVFIPVSNIELSRDWYCKLLGLSADCEIINDHLCPLPMQGPGIILDTMPAWGGDKPGGPPNIQTPAFMFLTENLQGSFDYATQLGCDFASGIEHNHWFVVKDPDGNLIMICRE